MHILCFYFLWATDIKQTLIIMISILARRPLFKNNSRLHWVLKTRFACTMKVDLHDDADGRSSYPRPPLDDAVIVLTSRCLWRPSSSSSCSNSKDWWWKHGCSCSGDPSRTLGLSETDQPRRVSPASAAPALDDFPDGLWRESGGRCNRAEVPWELD